MAVSIAEYLGQRVDGNNNIVPMSGAAKCPFMEANCTKITTGNKPICSVKKTNGDFWIVCKHRLCATLKSVPLNAYQKHVLLNVAKVVWGNDIEANEVKVKREVRMPVIGRSSYSADYIMVNTKQKQYNCPTRVVLEMQGGGETSSTGDISKRVQEWEENNDRTNNQLYEVISKPNTIETNAWRRQQEQFIIKGNIASQTGGGIVFCVGQPLFDYLYARVKDKGLNDLKEHNWSLCIIGFTGNSPVDKSLPIEFNIDPERVIFTNYVTFVQTLINQGKPYPQMFEGDFDDI